MIEIVFSVCSILHGAQCHQERLSFVSDPGELSVFACAKYGQAHLAKWAGEHPNHSIHRWSCRPARLEAKA